MVTTPKNAEEAAQMEAKLAEFRKKQAETELAERREKVKPLRELVESDAFAKIASDAEKLMPEFAAIEGIDVHLRPLARFMRNLREAVANYAPKEPVNTPTAEDVADAGA